MPYYEYECACGKRAERFRPIALRRKRTKCACGKRMDLIISRSTPALFFEEGGGGRTIENLGPQPVQIRSPAEHRAVMKREGVREAGARIGHKGCWF